MGAITYIKGGIRIFNYGNPNAYIVIDEHGFKLGPIFLLSLEEDGIKVLGYNVLEKVE